MCAYQKGNINIPTRGNRFSQEKVKLCIPKWKNLFPLRGNNGGKLWEKRVPTSTIFLQQIIDG